MGQSAAPPTVAADAPAAPAASPVAVDGLPEWAAAHAVPDAKWPGFARVVVTPYTAHFNPSPEHEFVWGVGLEWQRPDLWMFGAVYFSNSFGQPSGYLYAGQRYYDFYGYPKLFLQWTVGLLYGYVDEYQDKVPLNYGGYSPGLVVSAGWQFDRNWNAQLNLLGTAGLMLQLSYDLR